MCVHRLRLKRCRIDQMIIAEQNAHFIVHIPTQTQTHLYINEMAVSALDTRAQ